MEIMPNSDIDIEILKKAKAALIEAGKATPPILQRKLSIGLILACRIIKKLKEENFLGPYNQEIKAYTILNEKIKEKAKEKPEETIIQEDTKIYSAATHTERDFDWEIQSIRRQYQERIDFLMQSNKTDEEKQKEKQLLIENSFHDPRLPNLFYGTVEHAKEMRKIARRLDSIRKEDFLTMPYVLDWSQNKPQTITWIFSIRGNITEIEIDAIVNPANNTLMGGGGADGAIHLAAGPQLFDECMKLRKEKYPVGLPTGEAVITKGYKLPAKYVIHTVGPIWIDGYHREDELLYNCYFNSLLLAKENNIKTIAFPEISTGSYGYPKDEARRVADRAIEDFCSKYHGVIEEVVLVSF